MLSVDILVLASILTAMYGPLLTVQFTLEASPMVSEIILLCTPFTQSQDPKTYLSTLLAAL